MSKEVLILGASGTGKSSSLRNLDPSKTAIINVTGKYLPIKGYKSLYTECTKDNPNGNVYNVHTSDKVLSSLLHINGRPEIKYVILDDAGYIMSFEYIKRAKESGFAKFTDIGTGFSNIITEGKKLRDDLFFVVMMHPSTEVDATGNKTTKAKSVGSLVDNYLNIEGLFTIVLYTKLIKGNYMFITQNDGSNTGKSPMGMFDTLEIPNDLNDVFIAIDKYYK